MDDLGGNPLFLGNIQVEETAGLAKMKGETETTTKKPHVFEGHFSNDRRRPTL